MGGDELVTALEEETAAPSRPHSVQNILRHDFNLVYGSDFEHERCVLRARTLFVRLRAAHVRVRERSYEEAPSAMTCYSTHQEVEAKVACAVTEGGRMSLQ